MRVETRDFGPLDPGVVEHRSSPSAMVASPVMGCVRFHPELISPVQSAGTESRPKVIGGRR